MGKKNKFDKIERNEAYYIAYGEEEVTEKKEKKKKSLVGIDRDRVPEKQAFSSSFTYKREKKKPANEEEKAEKPAEIEKPVISVYILTLICVCLAFAAKLLLQGAGTISFVRENAVSIGVLSYVVIYFVPSVFYIVFNFRKRNCHYVKGFSPKLLPFSFACLGLVLSITALQKYLIAYTFGYSEPTTAVYEGLLAGVLLGALLPAVCEELLVHGILQKEVSEYAGGFAGIVVSSFVFAILHFELQYFLVYFFAAVIMGALTHTTRSCIPAMLVHFLNNALSILFSEKLGFIATERIGGTLLIIVIAAICFGFLILCLNIAEKISEARADAAANKDEGDGDVQIEYFFSCEGRSLQRFSNVMKTPPMLVVCVIFIIAVVMNMF